MEHGLKELKRQIEAAESRQVKARDDVHRARSAYLKALAASHDMIPGRTVVSYRGREGLYAGLGTGYGDYAFVKIKKDGTPGVAPAAIYINAFDLELESPTIVRQLPAPDQETPQ